MRASWVAAVFLTTSWMAFAPSAEAIDPCDLPEHDRVLDLQDDPRLDETCGETLEDPCQPLAVDASLAERCDDVIDDVCAPTQDVPLLYDNCAAAGADLCWLLAGPDLSSAARAIDACADAMDCIGPGSLPPPEAVDCILTSVTEGTPADGNVTFGFLPDHIPSLEYEVPGLGSGRLLLRIPLDDRGSQLNTREGHFFLCLSLARDCPEFNLFAE